mgnify:FL=1
MIIRKSQAELNLMREAGRIVAEVLELLARSIRPGVSTRELDKLAEELIRRRGAEPAFKGYRGFPASLCISINEEIVHGIPRADRILQEGDVASVDVGARYRGFYGDAARTFPVGDVGPEKKRLLDVTNEALWVGIGQAQVGNRLSDISAAVQRHVESHGYSVVRDFVGHGIGRNLHEEPQVPNFGEPGRGPRLKAGMVLAIEPMVNEGGPEARLLADRWTAVTQDGGWSAHFEHTVAITEAGPWILTLLDGEERLMA